MIARGTDASEAPPWLALVENYGKSAAGVLISPTILLTAAHVTDTTSISSCRIDSSSCVGAVKFRVEKVIRHPNYVNNDTHTV
jgi:V8-like Glu-specific endopeptidase